jgi:hypothetical protein
MTANGARRIAFLLLLGSTAAARIGCDVALTPQRPQSGEARGAAARSRAGESRSTPLFELIEALPAGSHILISLDFAPGAEAETQAIAEALVFHALDRSCRVHLTTLWATGESAAARAIEAALARTREPKVYGRDYVVLGFKSGGPGAINALVTDFRGLVTTDFSGATIDELEIMREIAGFDDYALVVTVSAGSPGAKEWAQFAGGRSSRGPRVAAAVSAIDAPALLPYVPRSLAALCAGLAGAAEYERLLARGRTRSTPELRSALSLAPAQIAGEIVFLGLIATALAMRALAHQSTPPRRASP